MGTFINDDQLYSQELQSYWTRAADQVDNYNFPELCFDREARPVAVGVFLQERPRVNLMGAVGARDLSGFQLSPSEMLLPGAYLLLDVCLTVREARRAVFYYRRQGYPGDCAIVLFAHPFCRSLLRWRFAARPAPVGRY